jgi:hypothetical protein
MKKLLLIALLIVGCDNSTESSPKEWICLSDSHPNSESESSDAVLKPIPDTHIFNSIEECEEACPDSILFNTIGTDKYMTFICSEYSSNP